MSRSRLIRSLVLPALLVAGLQAPALAQGTKVGLVDTRSLITQSETGKKILADLDALANLKSVQLRDQQEEIQALQKRIADGRVSLSEERLVELQKELDQKVTSARRLREDLQKEMEAAQIEAFGKFEEQVTPIVESFGEESGLDLILNIGFFNQPEQPSGIVWAKPTMDITPELIRRIDGATPAN